MSGRRRRFALAAVGLGLALGAAPLLAAELVLYALGLGDPNAGPDPYAGFVRVHRVFVPAGDGVHVTTSPAVASWFAPQQFPERKPDGEFRIFFLGESTVQGRPYSIETAFSAFTQIALNGMDPNRRYRAVNVGGISYASYRLVPILEELLQYDPDLLVLYSGHNEFLEDRTYAGLKKPGVGSWARRVAAHLRTFRVLEATLNPAPAPGWASDRPVLGPEVRETLSRVVGINAYERDPEWHADVMAHYRHNLRQMIATAREANVPVILFNPVENSSNCRPFKSQHREGESGIERRRCEEAVAEAKRLMDEDPAAALTGLQAALATDPLYAETHYWAGKAYEALGRSDAAREAYVRAKDLDVCPLRMLEPMRETVEAVARETGTPLIDARAHFERVTGTAFFGASLFVDHVHPTVEGHQLLADALVGRLVEEGYVEPTAPWTAARRDRLYAEHVASLGPDYFLDARLQLAQELGWAHRYDEAAAELQRLVREVPRVAAPALLLLGQIEARRGRMPEAVDCWRRAVDLDRGRVDDLSSIALYEAEMESYRAAEVALETFLALGPPRLMREEALFGLAAVRWHRGDRRGAQDLYAKIGLTPEEVRAFASTFGRMSWWGTYASLAPELAGAGVKSAESPLPIGRASR